MFEEVTNEVGGRRSSYRYNSNNNRHTYDPVANHSNNNRRYGRTASTLRANSNPLGYLDVFDNICKGI